jgi:hypothetical protein
MDTCLYFFRAHEFISRRSLYAPVNVKYNQSGFEYMLVLVVGVALITGMISLIIFYLD